MEDKKLFAFLKRLSKELPHFPDGRINYSHSKTCVVLNCTIFYKGKILLLKRSRKVRHYKGKWNTIGGYIDEIKSPKQKAIEEAQEELGIKKSPIKTAKVFNSFKVYDRKINRLWVVYPILLELKSKPKIVLDWEHTNYKWITPEEINKFDTIPNLDKQIKRMLAK